MKNIFRFKHIRVLNSLLAVLVVLFVLTSADVSLASQTESPNTQANIQSQEVHVDAGYFSKQGTLDGLTASESGLVLAQGKNSGSYVSDTVNTSLSSVSDIVPIWKTNLPEGTALVIETRLSVDGAAWSNWVESPLAFSPVRDNESAGDLIWVGGKKVALQFRVTLRGNSDTPTLKSLTLVFSDTSNGPTDEQIASQMAEVKSSANDCPVSPPLVVSRSGWGNPEGQFSPRRPPTYAPVTHIIVHQTETPNGLNYGQSWAGVVRSVWNFHANILRWGDVGYNYLIDPAGVIYEGRAGGDEVVGMHDGHNVGSMGIGFIGCYGSCDNPYLGVAIPSEPMLNSAVRLMAWQLKQVHIDPRGASYYGGLYNVPTIAGGRDVIATTSPGENIYFRLPELRDRAAGLADCQPGTPMPPITPIITTTPVATTTPTLQPCKITDIFFENNQYKVGDIINLTLKLADAVGNPLGGAKVTVEVQKEAAIQSFSGIGFLDRLGEYDGSYSNTNVAGSYRLTFRASDPKGIFAPCTAERTINVTQPANPTATMPPASTPTTIPTATPLQTPTSIAPTATTTPQTPTPTSTPTIPTMNNSLNFSPTNVCVATTVGLQTTTLNVANVKNLTAVDFEIAFNPKVMQVDEVVEGSAFANDKGFVVTKKADNSTGTIKFAATMLGGETLTGVGAFGLVTIKWKPVAVGLTQLRLDNVTLVADYQMGIDDVMVNHGFVQVGTNCTTTAGFVTLQGRSNYRGIIVTNANGEQVQTGTRGNFIIAGDGAVTVNNKGYLVAKTDGSNGVRSTDAVGNSQVNVGNITLLAGDVNNDNNINIFDLTYLASRMSTKDSAADLNKDGQVNIFDLVMSASNYGKKGPLTDWK